MYTGIEEFEDLMISCQQMRHVLSVVSLQSETCPISSTMSIHVLHIIRNKTC